VDVVMGSKGWISLVVGASVLMTDVSAVGGSVLLTDVSATGADVAEMLLVSA
jgi:hypothetical protein